MKSKASSRSKFRAGDSWVRGRNTDLYDEIDIFNYSNLCKEMNFRHFADIFAVCSRMLGNTDYAFDPNCTLLSLFDGMRQHKM